MERQIDQQVHLIGSTPDIPGVLSMMDVFSLTSHNEAKPVSILEALSCERPVAATAVGSVNESVLQGVTGFLVEAGDEQAMADRWLQLLSDKDLRQKMGAAGRRHVIENSSLDSMTNGYMELVESIFRSKVDLDTLRHRSSVGV